MRIRDISQGKLKAASANLPDTDIFAVCDIWAHIFDRQTARPMVAQVDPIGETSKGGVCEAMLWPMMFEDGKLRWKAWQR